MPATVILGGHWGDEAKGKVIDLLAGRFHFNVRYSGGANAGHTVVTDEGTYAFHQVPSGVLHPGLTYALAAGVVVEPPALLQELRDLDVRGIDLDRFYLSERAHLVMPYHRALDVALERERGEERLGTTGKGMGPAYADKAARDGIRVGDMLEPERFGMLVRRGVERANRQLTGLLHAAPIDADEVVRQAEEWRVALAPRVCDVERELRSALRGGQDILLEGAQGALLDLDCGSYPFVTSSSTGAAGACASTGLPPSTVDRVVSVMHAYMTRVGTGPFPTELRDETGELIRRRGNEFGTTTGRARRCGWFDAVASRYGVELNGVSSVALTKLDVLDGMERVRICVAYEVDGRRVEHVPSSAAVLARATPVYEDLPGWSAPTAEARRWEDLPPGARRYVARVEELMETPVSLISVGPHRDQTIMHRDPLAAL